MSSPRTLSYLHCATCNAQTLHNRNICPDCKTLNTMSARAPIPAQRSPWQNARAANDIAARNRARAARNRLTGVGR